MSFLVKEIITQDGLDDFLSVPQEIYRNDPNWIAPQQSEIRRVLDPVKNPYFLNASLKIYVCYFDGKPVCRSIMVINHLYYTKWNKKSAFFVFFDTYNPSYYPELLKEVGFSQSNLFHTRINNDISAPLSKKYHTSHKDTFSKDITVRKFNIFRFRRDIAILRDINNDAFYNNKFFLPLSMKEYLFLAKYLFLVTRPELIMIAEYKGEPVGAAQFVINFNSLLKSYNGKIRLRHVPGLLWRRRNIKDLIIFTAGIKKEYRNKRVFALILRSAVKIFRKFSTIRTTWISDENLGNSLASLLEMSTSKHFAIYSKRL